MQANDIAGGSHNIISVRQAFSGAYDLLSIALFTRVRQLQYDRRDHHTRGTLLGAILGVSYDDLKLRYDREQAGLPLTDNQSATIPPPIRPASPLEPASPLPAPMPVRARKPEDAAWALTPAEPAREPVRPTTVAAAGTSQSKKRSHQSDAMLNAATLGLDKALAANVGDLASAPIEIDFDDDDDDDDPVDMEESDELSDHGNSRYTIHTRSDAPSPSAGHPSSSRRAAKRPRARSIEYIAILSSSSSSSSDDVDGGTHGHLLVTPVLTPPATLSTKSPSASSPAAREASDLDHVVSPVKPSRARRQAARQAFWAAKSARGEHFVDALEEGEVDESWAVNRVR